MKYFIIRRETAKHADYDDYYESYVLFDVISQYGKAHQGSPEEIERVKKAVKIVNDKHYKPHNNSSSYLEVVEFDGESLTPSAIFQEVNKITAEDAEKRKAAILKKKKAAATRAKNSEEKKRKQLEKLKAELGE